MNVINQSKPFFIKLLKNIIRSFWPTWHNKIQTYPCMYGQNLKNISNVVALSMAFYVYAVKAVTTNFWSHLVVSVEGFARVVAHDEYYCKSFVYKIRRLSV